MRKLHLLFLFFTLFSLIIAQDEFEEDSLEKVPEEEDFQEDFSQQNNQQFQQTPQEQQEQQRQIIISCIILTQHFGSKQEKEFKEVLESHGADQSARMKAYNKVLGRLLDVCYTHMPIEKAQKVLSSLRDNSFKIENHLDVFNDFKWENYALIAGKTVDLQLTPQEESLLNFKEEFEKAMKERQQKEEDKDDFQKVNPEDYEPKIAGLSMKNAPKSLQIIYLVAVIGVAAIILIWGLNYLQKDHKLPGDKKNKKRKAKEQ